MFGCSSEQTFAPLSPRLPSVTVTFKSAHVTAHYSVFKGKYERWYQVFMIVGCSKHEKPPIPPRNVYFCQFISSHLALGKNDVSVRKSGYW